MALAGIWTPASELAFHIEYHYTTDPQERVTVWDILFVI